jgi:hypothetical protein
VTPKPVTYAWVPGDFTDCTALCGGGSQVRARMDTGPCKRQPSSCSQLAWKRQLCVMKRHARSRDAMSCYEAVLRRHHAASLVCCCPGPWPYQPFQQTRNLTCVSSVGDKAPLPACPLPAPPTERPCQQQECALSGPGGFELVFGPWSDCDAACGQSSQSRGVACQSKEGYLAQLTSCTGDLMGEW